jgi:hypothetical protein
VTDTSGLLVGVVVHPARHPGSRWGRDCDSSHPRPVSLVARICLPTASITAQTSATPWPNSVTGQSRSSHAPPGSLAFNSSRVAGLSSEPSPGSIETADWQRTSRPQSPAPQPGFISPPHSFSSGDWRTHSTTCTILIQTLSGVRASPPGSWFTSGWVINDNSSCTFADH